MACQYCGSDVPELETTCPVCGMSTVEQPVLVGSVSSTYQPGPSFVDLPDRELDFSNIPGWLQSFGESVAASDTQARVAEIEPAGLTGLTGPTLPSWLEEPRMMPAGAPSVPPTVEDVLVEDSVGFISEDDLPEWLRSIVDEPSEDHEVLAHVPSPFANGTIAAPAIALAWVTAQHVVALAPGEKLFARIAGEEAPHRADEIGEAGRHVEVMPATPEPVPSVEAAPKAATRNLRRVLIVALVVVTVLLVLVAMTQR